MIPLGYLVYICDYESFLQSTSVVNLYDFS